MPDTMPSLMTAANQVQEFTIVQWQQVDRVLRQAMAEDLPNGDVTTIGMFGYENFDCKAMLLAKEDGIVAGLPIVEHCLHSFNHTIKFRAAKRDGDRIRPGDTLAEVAGAAQSILTAERMCLNLLCHLSGIATLTRQYVDKVAPYKTKILDTRKTLPGLRLLQRYAVRVGGGTNHRDSLSDMGMIKDNHVRVAAQRFPQASFTELVRKIKAAVNVPVVLEIDAPDQIEQAKTSGADIVMLDNFSVAQLRAAVEQCKGSTLQLEASGNVTVDNVADVAATGVHRISVGRLTHSAKALDISLEISS